MWRVAARCLALAVGCSLSACLPSIPGILPPTVPTSAVFTPTHVAQSTAAPASTPAGISPTQTTTNLFTFTPIPTLTSTAAEPDTPATPAVTATITLVTPQPPVSSSPAESVSLDTLPRGTVYKPVHIQNRAHSQMDISLHCTTVQGLQTVLEYSSVRNLTVQAPDCDYVYVIYVGGRPMSGSFSLLHVPSVTITVYADRVAIH